MLNCELLREREREPSPRYVWISSEITGAASQPWPGNTVNTGGEFSSSDLQRVISQHLVSTQNMIIYYFKGEIFTNSKNKNAGFGGRGGEST